MERSELVAETLGEHVFDFFLRNKREEWQEYRGHVTSSRSTGISPALNAAGVPAASLGRGEPGA